MSGANIRMATTPSEHDEWIPTAGGQDDFSPLSPTSIDVTRDEQRTPNQEDQEASQPLCSVLNTVIDYDMRPPTSLEKEDLLEQQQQCESLGEFNQNFRQTTGIRVPVIRVFGPILRRQSLPTQHPPAQSACLHIHGAFPYILARPRLAGPDGSIHQNINGLDKATHLDWDDPTAVERFLPILKTNLEDAIQLSQASWTSGSNAVNSSGSANKTNHAPKIPAIFKLSVVMGRGFYTYCPGPPAPFVRIEYYNPSDRWKVKRALEKGLDSLPLFYHPDTFQYDPFGRASRRQSEPTTMMEEDDTDDVEIPEALQFHCYEAHIPYTMQFFKDWNLAGMSYIHVGQALFRHPLPDALRDNKIDPNIEGSYKNNERTHIPHEHLFLRSNTPPDLLWPGEEHTTCVNQTPMNPSQTNQSSNFPSHVKSPLELFPVLQQEPFGDGSQSSVAPGNTAREAPVAGAKHPSLEKETSCDVELDIHVSQIVNVHDVMTELPDDREERERIHWRAVPSLREIWKQERSRMSKLLAPENDFLSHTQQQDQQVPFTLSVKGKTAPMPGALLAVEGMRRLMNVSHGLEENYHRAMKQIVERYTEQVDWIDQRLKDRLQTTPESSSSQAILTPTFEDTFSALRELGKESGIIEQEDSDSDKPVRQCSVENESRRTSSEKFLGSTEPYYNPSKRASPIQPNNDFVLSQLVDQGESIVHGAFAHVDDFIDPETLRPYETIDDGDSILNEDDDGDRLTQEESLEKELAVMATQTLELGKNGIRLDPEPRNRVCASTRLQDLEDCCSDEEMNIVASEEILEEVSGSGSAAMVKAIKMKDDLVATSSVEKKLPPIRKEVADSAISTRLLPLPTKKQAPSWMKHLVAYSVCSTKWTQSANSHAWFSGEESRGGHASLTRCPPSRKSVVAWSNKQSKRPNMDQVGCLGKSRPKKARVSRGLLETKETDHLPTLVIDENSRKLVAAKTRRNQDVVDDKIHGKQVEEVDWYSSQTTSQPETPTPARELANSEEPLEIEELKPESQSSGTSRDLSLSMSKPTPQSSVPSIGEALDGMGQQGGRLWVEKGGRLKARTKPSKHVHKGYLPTPLTVVSIEVHVQCRTGRAGVNDSKQVSMVPDSEKDAVSAVVFVVAQDPGGGESLKFLVSHLTLESSAKPVWLIYLVFRSEELSSCPVRSSSVSRRRLSARQSSQKISSGLYRGSRWAFQHPFLSTVSVMKGASCFD